jgi:hypothetical protein
MQARQQNPLLLGALEGLLVQRPVWLLPALLEQDCLRGLESKPAAVEAAITLLTYRFSAGPWRTALIRKGYDPRKDRDSWRYQVISVILPDHFRNSAAHQQLQALASSQGSAWKGSVPDDLEPVAHRLSSSYIKLVTLQHIPVTKAAHFQVGYKALANLREQWP